MISKWLISLNSIKNTKNMENKCSNVWFNFRYEQLFCLRMENLKCTLFHWNCVYVGQLPLLRSHKLSRGEYLKTLIHNIEMHSTNQIKCGSFVGFASATCSLINGSVGFSTNLSKQTVMHFQFGEVWHSNRNVSKPSSSLYFQCFRFDSRVLFRCCNWCAISKFSVINKRNCWC